jgi:hypothetical protein
MRRRGSSVFGCHRGSHQTIADLKELRIGYEKTGAPAATASYGPRTRWADRLRQQGRVTLLRDIGGRCHIQCICHPSGLETLPLRKVRHAENAQSVVRYVQRCAAIARVIHPSTQTGIFLTRAQRYLNGWFEFAGARGSRAPLHRSRCRFSVDVVNIGDARRLTIHKQLRGLSFWTRQPRDDDYRCRRDDLR